LRQAIKHYALLRNKDEEASYLGDYANVLYENGKKSQAIKMLLTAENKMVDDARRAHLFNVLSNVYLHSNKADSAVYFAKLAFGISTELEIHTYAFNASSVLQMAYDTLDSMDQAYYWSIKNNKLMNEHYEDTRGTDIRITQLEAERKTQELENNYLRKKKEQDERFNQQSRVISIVSVAVAIIMLVVVIGLYHQRKQLIETQQLLKLQKDQTEEKNEELTKFINVRDKLISVASHDLRAPLTTLKNLLQVFKYPEITQEEIQEAMTMLEAQYERSIDMADNLLLWVKSQLQGIEPKKVSFDLIALNHELIDVFKSILSTSDVKVEVNGTANANVYADKEMVMFVLRNLLHNAIKFSPEGAIVHIEILEFNDFMQWTVKDEGNGINPKVIPNLFKMNRVENASDPKRGAGLGLYLSKFFAEQNDGKLSVESKAGEGAKMILKLPKGQ
jgi:signal transduction histidine kinase